MSAEDRSRPPPLPRDRARQDQAEPAQVHLAGRADRQQGQGPGLDPAAADRHPALPLRQQADGRRRAGRRATSATRSARATEQQPAQGKAGDQAGRARARGRASRSRSWRRSSARSWSCRASSPRARSGSSRRRTVHRHPPHRARSRCATSSARSGRRCSGRSRRARTTRRTRHRARPRGQALPLAGRRAAPQSQRGHHLHDGRVGLDGRRAEGDRPHRVASGSTPGCSSQYKGLESRYIIHDADGARRSTATPSSTRASRAAR